jgi:predicted MFS family arabinose efflux permease
MIVSAVAMLMIAVAQALGVVVAGLLVLSLGAGLSFTPAIAALSEAAEAARLHEGLAAGLSNIAWAASQVAGSLFGGGVASAVGFAAPNLAIAALLAATAIYASRELKGGYARPVSAE